MADALSRYFLGDDSPEASEEDDPGIVINNVGVASARPRPAPRLDDKQASDADIVQLFKWITRQEEPGAEPPESASKDLQRYHASVAKFKLINGSVYRERIEDGASSVFQYVVPRDRREAIINSFHDSPTAGHFNNETVTRSIQQRFFWPGAWSQIKKHCQECERCAKAKATSGARASDEGPLDKSEVDATIRL